MKNTSNTCRCRVPLSESAVPVFERTSQLLEWADKHGVDLAPDHLNRLSVDVDTAYRLRDESNAAAEKHAAEDAARKAKLQAAITKAQEKRQKAFAAAYTASLLASGHPSMARNAGREAIEEAERNLDPSIRNQLASAAVPDVHHAGVGRFVREGEG